ncbi:hypothetical protein LIA77_01072 [Sarocladium implicatum]|nr:hypothetical protein LIA77_01072 [Sarocladium implicatum]
MNYLLSTSQHCQWHCPQRARHTPSEQARTASSSWVDFEALKLRNHHLLHPWAKNCNLAPIKGPVSSKVSVAANISTHQFHPFLLDPYLSSSSLPPVYSRAYPPAPAHLSSPRRCNGPTSLALTSELTQPNTIIHCNSLAPDLASPSLPRQVTAGAIFHLALLSVGSCDFPSATVLDPVCPPTTAF